MAVQAQFGGFAGGCLPPGGGGFAEEQMRALLSSTAAAVNNNGGYYRCPGAVVVSGGAAQSELTCNASGGAGVLPSSSRKRGRDAADCFFEQYVASSSAAALLPVPPALQKGNRAVDSMAAAASTSGRAFAAAQEDPQVSLSELCQRQAAEIDALVRAECERLRAGMKRQCRDLVVRAVLAGGAAARSVLREKEAELDAARRRAAELEERLRRATAESQAWCGLARGHEAVAAELRAALDHFLLLRGAAEPGVEGFGDSDNGKADDDAAQSCCFEQATAALPETAGSPANKWACKSCGEREASVLLLPCRHLCLCKACEPRTDACPVCLAVKNASIHVAPC